MSRDSEKGNTGASSRTDVRALAGAEMSGATLIPARAIARGMVCGRGENRASGGTSLPMRRTRVSHFERSAFDSGLMSPARRRADPGRVAMLPMSQGGLRR